jgi:hypothetical protein
MHKNRAFAATSTSSILATKNTVSGKTDIIIKLRLVRIQIKAYFSSSFFVLTILMINTKNNTEPIISVVRNVPLIFILIFLYHAFPGY